MSDTPPTLPANQEAPPADPADFPEGYQPPLVAGGLFVDPNWVPRLADRLGSVRTDMGGVPEHWPQDLVPVMYPHLPNGFWREVPVEVLSLTSISPSNGPLAGGTPLTLTGTGFVDIVAINWEITSYSPADFVVVDSEHITCLSPTGAPGPGSIDVEVVNAADDVGRLPSGFTYIAPDPQITSLSPNMAVAGTPTSVTVNGSNFDPDAQVEVNGTAQTTTFVSASRLTANYTPVAAGTVQFSVRNMATTAESNNMLFTVTAPPPAPTISTIVPTTGSIAGGDALVITGGNFVPGMSATIDGVLVTNGQYINPMRFECTSPPGAAGAVDVMVTTTGGTATLPGGYTYAPPPPTVTSITPNTGPAAGGVQVTLAGTNMTGATGVSFGGTVGSGFSVVNATTVNVTTPAHINGAVDVVLQHPAGNFTSTGGFTYLDTPVIIDIQPNAGVAGDALHITGGGFSNVSPVSGVTIGGTVGDTISVQDDNNITVQAPVGPTGTVDVVVTDGTYSNTLPGGFTYTAGSDDVMPQSSDSSDVQAVAQTIQENAETIGEAAQNIGEAAQTLTEPSGTDPASSPTSEAPSVSEGTTEAPVTGQEPDMTEYEMDQLWGIEPAQGSTPEPASSS